MGVRIGSTENAKVCQDLLAELIDRGLEHQDGILAVIDGSKALRKALKTVYGTMVQRWVSAAMLDAERRAHRIEGYRFMSILIAEIRRLTTTSEISRAEKESLTA